jgi:hypothetical protein
MKKITIKTPTRQYTIQKQKTLNKLSTIIATTLPTNTTTDDIFELD